jgi:hypothetical protein
MTQTALHTPSAPAPQKLSPLLLADNCKFRIRTVEEAMLLSPFLSAMFRDPERVRTGIFELLLNAVEHGCLGIGHELKIKLTGNRTWQTEIARRQSLPENRKKSAEVVIARRPDGIFLVITDPGTGFEWKPWLSLDPARAGDAHGRGIARARNISFDSLTYNATGNQVAAHSRDVPDKSW